MTTDWMRRGAAALALARTALGVAALAWPSLIARPWVAAALARIEEVLADLGGSALDRQQLRALGRDAVA